MTSVSAKLAHAYSSNFTWFKDAIDPFFPIIISYSYLSPMEESATGNFYKKNEN